MSKICQMTGKKSNNGYTVSHSHTKTKKIQKVNLQNKKIWSYKKKKWIKIKISTKALKSFYKLDS
uniref:ribosomal protein L28 n=1 Tax=Hypnea brasiliensis TaxID=1866962 RepID=UPI0023F3142F|nr:ribosomal protein L28 [Hypnea brasiliensis]WCH55305.1 ribosomal protein L28 [Hypnea brasiliensis]WDY84722.1 ribosomal protein L28 [Hypnea brasiliensis]